MLERLLPLLLLLSTVAYAAPAPKNRQAAEVTAALIEEMFVYPDKAKQIADHLRKQSATGAFDDVAFGAALAQALTKAMHAIEDDKHVNVQYDSEGASEPLSTVADALARLKAMRAEGRGGRGGQGDIESQRKNNFGVRAVEHLPGNVGYLRLDTFADMSTARHTLAAAMKMLEHTDAMIIDLRQNRGGSNSSVVYLASHFLPTNHGPLVTMRRRSDAEPVVSNVVETPTRNFEKKPLYILTSNGTFSAGEAFAYMLQQFGRAKTVGETTKGGGRPNAFIPLGAGLTLSVSIAAVEHPKTKTNWQGVGVTADVQTAAADALDTARRLLTAKSVEVPAHVAPLIAALNGTSEELEQYAARNYSKSLFDARTPEERARFHKRFQGDFGRATVTAIEAQTSDRTVLRIEGTSGRAATLVIEHEPAPRHAIITLQIELRG